MTAAEHFAALAEMAPDEATLDHLMQSACIWSLRGGWTHEEVLSVRDASIARQDALRSAKP